MPGYASAPVLPSRSSEGPGRAAGKTPTPVGPARVASKDAKGIRAERRSYLSPGGGGHSLRGRWSGGRPRRRWADAGSGWSRREEGGGGSLFGLGAPRLGG